MKKIIAILISTVVATAATAQSEYPAKPVEAVVGYAPGGTADIVMRELARHMETAFPKGIVVVNKPGAGGAAAIAAMINGKADGYSFVFAPNSNLALSPQLIDLSYKSPDDVRPVVNVVKFSPVLVVTEDSPYRSLEDIVEAAKEKPGAVTVGLPGLATISDFNIITLEKETGAKFNRIPFGGWGQGGSQLMGGHIDAVVAQPLEVIEQVNSGTLRVLASFSEERQIGLENSPTAQEQGFPTGFSARYEIVVAKDAPEEAVQIIHDAALEATKNESFVSFANSRGMEIDYRDGAATAEANRDDFDRLGEILKDLPPPQ